MSVGSAELLMAMLLRWLSGYWTMTTFAILAPETSIWTCTLPQRFVETDPVKVPSCSPEEVLAELEPDGVVADGTGVLGVVVDDADAALVPFAVAEIDAKGIADPV